MKRACNKGLNLKRYGYILISLIAAPLTKSLTPWLSLKLTGCSMSKPATLNLETSVGSRKSAQALCAPSKAEKCLITNKVTTNFYASLCTPISYASFSRPTEVSRLNSARIRLTDECLGFGFLRRSTSCIPAVVVVLHLTMDGEKCRQR